MKFHLVPRTSDGSPSVPPGNELAQAGATGHEREALPINPVAQVKSSPFFPLAARISGCNVESSKKFLDGKNFMQGSAIHACWFSSSFSVFSRVSWTDCSTILELAHHRYFLGAVGWSGPIASNIGKNLTTASILEW